MTALPLQSPVLRLASTSLPAPLRRIFDDAGLAEPRAALDELIFETESGSGVSKILITFSLARADLNLFMLLSPALAGVEPSVRRSNIEELLERDFPWWGPEPGSNAPGSLTTERWFSFATAAFDAVDLVVEDAAGRISIRAIRCTAQ